MKALVKVLYEDQQAADATNFGLHLLVSRCVLERLGWPEERWSELQRQLIGQPKKGDSKLLAACHDAREARSVRHVLAVFDDDKVRKISALGLKPGACKLQVREAIRKPSPYAAQFAVVLLERTMESVVAAVQRCKGSPVSGKLAPLERDRILASVAWRSDAAPIRA